MISRDTLNGKWPTVILGDVVEFLDHLRRPVTAKDRQPGPYPYYGANGQQDSVAEFIFDEPLVLLAEDGGHFGDPDKSIAYQVNGKCWVNNHAHVLRPTNRIDIRFLCRHLERYDVRPFTSGTTRLKLNKGKAELIPLALPPLPEQKRIADILDKADAIRRKRQEAVFESQQLLPSLFAKMFGEGGCNYEPEPLGDHLEFLTSGSRGWAKHYVPSGKRFIRSLDVQMNRIGSDHVAFVDPPNGTEAERTRVRGGDVLITITGSCIGRVAFIPDSFGEAYVSQHVAIARLKPTLRPRYCSMFLSLPNGGQRVIAKAQYGQTKPGLSLTNIRNFQVPIPPLAEQDEFLDAWDHFDRTAANLFRSVSECDGLFNALVQRAFKGEL